ncbi:MAG: O-antigen ligase family protein, partial [Lachnospiraceae bacterium]|nr:O-antigen ligase family protein [Lachnospiraceae bacterium]
EREEIKSDPSNRRFSIWKSGLELVKESPVFGLGRYTYTPYAADRLPDTYIVSNGLQEFDAMHNILMDVLVSQGVVGLVLFVILMLYCICKIVKNRDLLLSEKCWEFAVFNFIILVVNVAAAMVLPNLLYINSPGAYVSWLCLGNMINLIKGGEIKEET